MLEIDRIAVAQIDLRHRHDFPLHLTRAGVELKLGHVLEPRRFPPARLADQVADIQRSPARAASQRRFLVHALTPLALNSLQGFARGNMRRVSHTNSIRGRPSTNEERSGGGSACCSWR